MSAGAAKRTVGCVLCSCAIQSAHAVRCCRQRGTSSSEHSQYLLGAGKRLLAACYMQEDHFDLIDVDMHGSDSTCIGPALDAIRYGGLLFATCTDGFSSSGKRPTRALAAYGAFTRVHPSCGEQGLRMLIGAVLREAAVRGLVVQPVFSLYSAHGPVFRVMLRVTRSRDWPHRQYGFVGFSHVTGGACVIPFECVPAAAATMMRSGACAIVHRELQTYVSWNHIARLAVTQVAKAERVPD